MTRLFASKKLTHLLVMGSLVNFLVACTTPSRFPPPANPDFYLSGRMVVKVENGVNDPSPPQKKTFTGHFDLKGTPDDASLTLSTLLGTQLAQVRWRGSVGELKTSDGVTKTGDIDSVAEGSVGERIPLRALTYWLRGQPVPTEPSVMNQQPNYGFNQLGWTVDLSQWNEHIVIARQLQPKLIEVRVKLDQSYYPLPNATMPTPINSTGVPEPGEPTP